MNKEHKEILLNKAIRKAEGKIYYFDSNGCYRSVLEEEVKEGTVIFPNIIFRKNGTFFLDTVCAFYIGFDNQHMLISAVKRMQEGETISELEKHYIEVKMRKK